MQKQANPALRIFFSFPDKRLPDRFKPPLRERNFFLYTFLLACSAWPDWPNQKIISDNGISRRPRKEVLNWIIWVVYINNEKRIIICKHASKRQLLSFYTSSQFPTSQFTKYLWRKLRNRSHWILPSLKNFENKARDMWNYQTSQKSELMTLIPDI